MNWYSVFVRSFADSNGDGIGDLRGLIRRLDYLEQLGIEGIWLLPVHPAPSYHKYDVMDYFGIDAEYGTLHDFQELVREAHKRNIKIMLDLVLNHTSEQHPWFKRALRSKRDYFREHYVWKPKSALGDNEYNWHVPVRGPQEEVYYGLFWKGMPDLNYDSPEVRREMIEIARYWLGMGVDGFRLDAAMHIYPPGLESENIRWWQEFRAALEKDFPEVYLVGEITESCAYIQPYLDNGLHACFNFELAERLIQAVNTGHHTCFVDWYQAILKKYQQVNKGAGDALFLSNHDQTRVATRLNNDPDKIKLAASLLLTLPGEVFIYYGEELGMKGDKPDEQIREPFLWKAARTIEQCKWVRPVYSLTSNTSPLDEQTSDSQSIYHHYRELLQLRKDIPCLVKGIFEQIECKDSAVIVYTLRYQNERVLVMHNLSETNVILRNEDKRPVGCRMLYASNGAGIRNNSDFYLPGRSSLLSHIG